MVLVDYLLLAAVVVSALIGLFRGLVKEALSLAVWIGALWCAARFGEQGSVLLSGRFEDPLILLWAGRLLVFVVVLFAGSLLSWLAGYLIRHSPVTGTDRTLGVLFGVGRGVIVAGLFVLGLKLAGFDREPWWQQSKLIPYAATVGEALRDAAEDRLGNRDGYRDVDGAGQDGQQSARQTI